MCFKSIYTSPSVNLAQCHKTFHGRQYMDACNKMQCLSLESSVLAGRARSLRWCGAPERCYTLVGSGLNCER
jgi:hypothetical protein